MTTNSDRDRKPERKMVRKIGLLALSVILMGAGQSLWEVDVTLWRFLLGGLALFTGMALVDASLSDLRCDASNGTPCSWVNDGGFLSCQAHVIPIDGHAKLNGNLVPPVEVRWGRFPQEE